MHDLRNIRRRLAVQGNAPGARDCVGSSIVGDNGEVNRPEPVENLPKKPGTAVDIGVRVVAIETDRYKGRLRAGARPAV